MTMVKRFLTSCGWACFRIGSHTMPAQRCSQPTPTSFGKARVYACLGVTCHLHFWQNDWGILHATAITSGWDRHWIRVRTQSWLWRRKFSNRSCQYSNWQPFVHESSALTNKLSQLPLYILAITVSAYATYLPWSFLFNIFCLNHLHMCHALILILST